MDASRAKMKSKQSFYKDVVAAFIVIFLIGTVMSSMYYMRMQEIIRDESKNYLQEISLRIGNSMDRIIKDTLASLKTMGVSAEALGEQQAAKLYPILQKQRELWSYEDVFLVDSNGNLHDINQDGASTQVFGETLPSETFEGKPTVTTQVSNGVPYIFATAPLNHTVVDGVEMISIAATYRLENLERNLTMESFDERAYSQIITKAGAAVTYPTVESAIEDNQNVFSMLETAKLEDGAEIDDVRDGIQKDTEGQIVFTLNDERWYMVYTPIQPEEWYLLTFVPAHVVNENSDKMMKSSLVIGVILILLFSSVITTLVYIYSTNRRRLERMAYVDEVTCGNTIERFYELACETLDEPGTKKYALVYSNIENFKVLNSQLGREVCDEILKHFYAYTKSLLRRGEVIGRYTADNFCILLNYQGEEQMMEWLANWVSGSEKYNVDRHTIWDTPRIELGIYVIDDKSMPLTEMIDRAKLALKKNKQHADKGLSYAFYDEKTREEIFREKKLTDMMYTALQKGEFQLYLQPKVHLPDETIGGAEALVRWVSSSEGIILPNDFIPLFEKNGFIVQMDLYLFETVCQTIRNWIDSGLEPVKVSVNCSRVHFNNPKFLEPYIQMAQKYNIRKNLIEIELTESIVFEDTTRLRRIIQEIRVAGFGCAMDDFGSGYSSLNLLQSVPVDTLKIDKIFFQKNADNNERTEVVVRSIVKMAKELSLTTVAEGVEYQDQVSLLKRMGCDYIQGYVFGKPMTVPEFNKLAFGITEN